MHFDLIHADRVSIFPTKEEADLLILSDTGSITYSSVYTQRGKGWLIQRKHADQVTGYLEKEDA